MTEYTWKYWLPDAGETVADARPWKTTKCFTEHVVREIAEYLWARERIRESYRIVAVRPDGFQYAATVDTVSKPSFTVRLG